jgi:hypothetical protein
LLHVVEAHRSHQRITIRCPSHDRRREGCKAAGRIAQAITREIESTACRTDSRHVPIDVTELNLGQNLRVATFHGWIHEAVDAPEVLAHVSRWPSQFQAEAAAAAAPVVAEPE